MRTSLGSLAAAGTLLFATAALAATVTYTNVLPTLPFSDPGYAPNGSITAHVADVPECTTGVFTVNATPVAGSGPSASNPPSTSITTYIGFNQGSFLFSNAGYGSYTITTTTTACGVGAPPPPTVDVVTLSEPPTIVPTLTEWALILFGLILAGGAALYIQRRHMAA